MIPIFRSLTELKAITESRDNITLLNQETNPNRMVEDSGQRKRYLRSIKESNLEISDLPKPQKNKWNKSKELASKFINKLDCNDHIQYSYDLTLLRRHDKNNHKDAA